LICVLKGVEKGYSSVNAIALSPDGTRLAAALGDEGENSFVHLWDILSGVKVGVFRGHRGGVTQLAFSPDGLHLASTSVDTTVVIWNVTDLPAVPPVKDGKEVATLWDDLGSGDPEVSYTAACRGAQAGDTAVNVLKTRLKPVASVAPAKVAELVRQLDAEVFADRERASRALRDLGPGVGHLLRKTVKKNESAEVRNRVEAILSLFAAEHCRSAQALEMLEMIGTQKAMQLLQDLAGGAADARLTQDAADALKRLKGRQTPRNRT
jgi:hypothetical protein